MRLTVIAILIFFSTTAIVRASSTVDSSEYRKIFLSAEDLSWMKLGQDQSFTKPDDDDKAFATFQGQLVGMKVWNAAGTDTVMRINDIRWVFPDDSSAERYFLATLRVNSEGAPLIAYTRLGDDNRAYGGPLNMGGFKMVNYYSLFRVGRVVCKLFVSQGYEIKGQSLQLDRVQQIGQRIVDRIRSARL